MGENMSISKRFVITVFASAVLFSVFVLLVEGLSSDKQPQPTEPKSEISAESGSYRVQSHNGRIAVFIDGDKTPLYILDAPLVSDLPEYDQNLLNMGITAESNAELLKILEDYDN